MFRRPPAVEDHQDGQLPLFAGGACPVPYGLPHGPGRHAADLGPYDRQYVLLPATTQDPVMADAYESLGQNMQCEAPDEFRVR